MASRVTGGQWLQDKADAVRDRLYGAYALVYLVEGGGVYSDPVNGSRTVARGDVLCLFPDLRHSYARASSPRWSEGWIGFAGPLFPALEAEGLLDRRRPVRSPGHHRDLVAAFDALIKGPHPTPGPGPVAAVHRLLADIALHEAAGLRVDDLTAAAQALFEEDLGAPLDLAAAARRLGVGYDHLRRAFTASTGRSPTRWRLERRVERARHLLAQGSTLAECAEQLGYCDLHHFARQFKRVTGVTPGSVRS